MKSLTVFTPTYNRAHTLTRLYESLCVQTCKDFEWLVIDDGSTDGTRTLVEGYKAEGKIPIRYIYKENGGLYTGYNVAYTNIQTELCVCIDSDDAMPSNAVELILEKWKSEGGDRYAGIIGLDYYMDTNMAIGGRFPKGLHECWLLDLYTKKIHVGDTKQAMRTDLMRRIAPQEGFEGEKDFNPIYMLLQVCDCLPLLVLNENLCNVEYQQGDSMSANIFRQYKRSPRSFAKQRRMEMQLKHNTYRNKVRSAIHYVAESLIAHDGAWLKQSPMKTLTVAVTPIGLVLYFYILWKNRH